MSPNKVTGECRYIPGRMKFRDPLAKIKYLKGIPYKGHLAIPMGYTFCANKLQPVTNI